MPAGAFRWQKPGTNDIHKSVAKFHLPVPPRGSKQQFCVEAARAIVKERYLEMCGDSRLRDDISAAQFAGLNTNPGTWWVARGFATKKLLYYSDNFFGMLRWIRSTQLGRGKYKPICDVNGKTEVIAYDKTGRTVYCVDAVTLVFQQMFFGHQLQLYSRAPLDSLWSWVGKTAYGTGALEAFNWITEEGKRDWCYDFDVKKMEASIRTDDLVWLAKLHFGALHPDDQTDEVWQCVLTLYLGLAESPFIIPDRNGQGHFFWKGGNGQGGEPSGHLLTALDNSLITLYLVALAFVWQSVSRGEEPSTERFWRWHRGMVMGDDLRLTLSRAAKQWWQLSGDGPIGAHIATSVFAACGTVLESTSFEGTHIMDSVFCGWKFYEMKDPVHWITFKTDFGRAVDAVKQGGDHTHSAQACVTNLGRINNMRVSTWADPTVREQVVRFREQFIRLSQRRFKELRNNPEWAAVKGAFLTDGALQQLYTGLMLPIPTGKQSKGFAVPELDEDFNDLS